MTSSQIIRVAVAAIVNAGDEVCIAKRPDHTHMGGYWEFPGGKIESGESTPVALQRELWEELGIRIDVQPEALHPLICLRYQYPEKTVELDVWKVRYFDGDPYGREGQPVKWQSLLSLDYQQFPPANRAILDALRLPDRLLVTGEFADTADCIRRVKTALSAGIKLIQLRCPGLDSIQYQVVAESLLPTLAAHQGRLMLNLAQLAANLDVVKLFSDRFGDAIGWHLTASQLRQFKPNSLAPETFLSAACHNAEELALAAALQCNYATLAPIQATQTHPDSKHLGWAAAAELIAAAALPVYMLGGMQVNDLKQVRQIGAQGIAAIRAFWPF